MKRVGGDGRNVVNHAFTVAVRSDVADRLQEA